MRINHLRLAAVAALAALLVLQAMLYRSYLMIADLALMFFFVLQMHPIVFREHEKGAPADDSVLSDHKGAAQTLLILPAGIRNENYSGSNWSFQWLNILSQELGHFEACYADQLSPGLLKARKLVILSRGAQAAEGSDGPLAGFVRAGGVLFCEYPGKGMRDLCGVETKDERTGKKITFSDCLRHLDELQDLPVSVRMLDTRLCADAPVSVLMRIDGNPVMASKPLGRGMIISCMFDLSGLYQSLVQGRPADDFHVGKRYHGSDHVTSLDLLSSARLLDSRIPYANLLRKTFVSAIQLYLPLPRLHYFPYEHDGAIVMTHDEDYYGDKARILTDYERQSGIKSTYFIIPDSSISDHTLADMSKTCQIALHWNRAVKPWFKLIIYFNPPLFRLRSVRSQIGLRDFRKPIMNRIHFFKWDADYTEPFRIMDSAGIVLDSSYGPSGDMGRGYMFGSGLPYHPLDKNGLPFRLYECPVFSIEDAGNINLEYLAARIKESRDTYHEVLTLCYHPEALDRVPGYMAEWKALLRMKGHNHWMTNFSELYSWVKKREKVEYSYSWNGNQLRIKAGSDACMQLPRIFQGKECQIPDNLTARKINDCGKDYYLFSLKPAPAPRSGPQSGQQSGSFCVSYR
ncbi:MAG: hypothetical protein ABH879_10015 [archaeon]